jgi:hypothetical protein
VVVDGVSANFTLGRYYSKELDSRRPGDIGPLIVDAFHRPLGDLPGHREKVPFLKDIALSEEAAHGFSSFAIWDSTECGKSPHARRSNECDASQRRTLKWRE